MRLCLNFDRGNVHRGRGIVIVGGGMVVENRGGDRMSRKDKFVMRGVEGRNLSDAEILSTEFVGGFIEFRCRSCCLIISRQENPFQPV